MIRLGVNIDHVATIRQARKTYEPDPVQAAFLAERAGADGITIHLREDRRHIQDRDLVLLKQIVQTKLNLEMALSPEIVELALQTEPHQVTFVPEKREEVTTEGGLDCLQVFEPLKKVIGSFKEKSIEVSLFIEPDMEQIRAAHELNADRIEFHTGKFALSYHKIRGRKVSGGQEQWIAEIDRLIRAGEQAHRLGLNVSAGHGLNYFNIPEVFQIPALDEVNIGHSIISRAVFTGLEDSVREMKKILQKQ